MVVGPWVPLPFARSFLLEASSLVVKCLSVKPCVMCQLFPAGTLTNAVTLEKLKHVLKLAFTQEFVQFFRRHGLEGLVRGSEDSVDPFPVECLRQPCRLDGGDQHAVGTHTENVTCPWGLSYTSPLRAGGAQSTGIHRPTRHKRGPLRSGFSLLNSKLS